MSEDPRTGMTSWREAAARETKRSQMTPRHLGLADYLAAALQGSWNRARRVPSAAITEDGVDGEGEFAFVACPCGAHPVVRTMMEKCAGCERWYLLAEMGAVYVIYGAMDPPTVGGTA